MRFRRAGVLVLFCLSAATFAVAQVRQEIRFPDVAGYRTLKCDLHMHTVFSDGLVWPTVRVDEAWRQGLDAISITDHIEYKPHRDDVSVDQNRPFELAAARARERNIILIRGAEITRETPPGHFNAIFLRDVAPLEVKDFFEVFRQAAAQQAFVFWNHPGWKGPEAGRWTDDHARIHAEGQLHGVEICNGNTWYEDGHRYALEKNLVLIGTSDEHGPFGDRPWTAEEHRTLTLVLAAERSEQGIREALFAGRTLVWCQNRLFGRPDHLAAMFEAAVEVRAPHARHKGETIAELINRCALDLELERVAGPGPSRIRVPAGGTVLVRFRESPDGDAARPVYRVTNMLSAPGKPLEAALQVPAPELPQAQPG